jgi:hypothetical protein
MADNSEIRYLNPIDIEVKKENTVDLKSLVLNLSTTKTQIF